MHPAARLFLAALILALSVAARADTLTLRNGTVLNGKFLNNTGEAVRFQTVTGDVQTIPNTEILNLSTDPSSAAMVAPASAAYSPTLLNVKIPAGTVLLVQVMDAVSAKSAPGTDFTTKLQDDLVAGGGIAAPAGTIVYGKIQGSAPGGLDLRLTSMVANGIPVPLTTGSFALHVEPGEKKSAAGKSGPASTLPAGTLLEFTLQQPVTVSMVR